MFSLERQQKIMELIKTQNSIKVNELSKTFNVSESTIRRDLKEMEERGLLMRTHGGALDANSTSFEPSFKDKKDERREDKLSIGKLAAGMIENGDTIILDTGTTTIEIAKNIEAKDITIVTNSIDIAEIVSHIEGVQLILTGGNLRYNTRAMVGHITENTIRRFRIDKAFIGANGISIEAGITTPNFSEAYIKKAMIEQAKKRIITADSSKFNKICFSVICPINNIDTIITAGQLDKNILKEYKEKGVEIIFAK